MEDMKKEELLEALIKFRTKLEEGLKEGESIADITYIGNMDLSDGELPLYVVLKQLEEGTVNEYYIGNTQIGIDTDYGITIDEAEIGTVEEAADIIKYINDREDSKENVSLNELEKERFDKLAEIVGGEVTSYSEINPNQELKLEEKENEKIDLEEQNVTEEQLEHMTTLQSMNPNDKITDTENMRDMIPEISEKGFIKIGVVYSDKVEGGEGRFTFVGVKADGTVEKLESLEMIQEGVNKHTATSINSRDGSVIEQENVSTMVRIKGGRDIGAGKEDGFSVKVGPHGVIEVDYVRAELSQGRNARYVSAPVETETQRPSTKDVRRFMDHSKNLDMDGEAERTKQDPTNLENIKDENNERDLNGGLSIDYDAEIVMPDGSTTTIREQAGKQKVSIEEFMRYYNNASGNTPAERIEGVSEEINNDFRGPDTRPRE